MTETDLGAELIRPRTPSAGSFCGRVRPPLPDALVAAVQRPIVDAVRKLRPTDERRRILEGIREILFVVHDDGPPL